MRDNNLKRELPTVRLHKIVVENFKSVVHGEIEMACAKKFVPLNTQSDILGVYGQNGSGKTSLIEALSIFQYLVKGESIPDDYADCIMSGAESARLEYTFDFQYETKSPCKVIYEVMFGLNKDESGFETQLIEGDYSQENSTFKSRSKYLVVVNSEIIRVAGDFEGGKKLQAIIDTAQGETFGPVSKQKYFVNDKESLIELKSNKSLARDFAQSFIFMNRSMRVFNQMKSEYIDVLNDMQRYASFYLYVVDTKSSGLIRLNSSMPIIVRKIGNEAIMTKNRINLGLKGPNKLSSDLYSAVKFVLDNINIVLCKLIPGLTIDLKDLGPVLLPQSNVVGKFAELVSVRNGVELPLRDESDGVKKIISTLQLYIEAYNDPSMTIAIDEFDAGVFEYLLGEMLAIFEESGKGQFIFTSHNLRPLEVLNKNFICFTTTNPEDRYTRLDNIKPNNNLRNVYFREIELGGESEDLYSSEKKYKIVQALRKAGQASDDETR